MFRTMHIALPARLGVALASAALVAGCGAAATEGELTPAAAPALTATDPWVKATDTEMTAAFAILTNESDADVAVVSATSDAAGMVELHEMAMVEGRMLMRPKPGGIVVPAGGQHVLEPGGDHIMLMDLSAPLVPGDEVAITVTMDDGSTLDISAPVKAFTGADEDYQSDADGS